MKVIKKFKQIFAGLDYAYGNFKKETNNIPSKKVEGKSTVIRKPVTDELWKNHLEGVGLRLGIFPVTAEGTCRWGVIDIDQYSYDYEALLKKIRKEKLPLIMCRSKSGGAHIFLFTETLVPAVELKYAMEKCAAILGVKDIMDRIYPMQTKILASRGDTGSYLNIPYYNAEEGSQYAFNDDFSAASLEEFFKLYDTYVVKDLAKFLKESPHLPETIKTKRRKKDSPYTEAPPCLIALIREKIKSGERDQGLFNLGVFYKRAQIEEAFKDKNGKNHTWQELVREGNRRYIEPPLTDREVNKTISSLERHEYERYTCGSNPIRRVCNPTICLTRKYGITNEEFPKEAKQIFENLTELESNPRLFFIDVQPDDLTKDKIRVDLEAHQLRKKDKFYDAVLARTGVWLPDMKVNEFNVLMSEVYKTRNVEKAEIEEDEDQDVRDWFDKFVEHTNAYAERSNLLQGVCHYNAEIKVLEFRMDMFIEFCRVKQIKLSRPKIIARLKRILKAKKKHATITGDKEHKISTWTIPDYTPPHNTYIIEGTVEEPQKITPDGQ